MSKACDSSKAKNNYMLKALFKKVEGASNSADPSYQKFNFFTNFLKTEILKVREQLKSLKKELNFV